MSIRELLPDAFSREEAEILYAAYDEIVAGLQLENLPAYLAAAIARKVISIGESGEFDHARIVKRARRELRITAP